jgi:hypothetical protein
VTQHEVARGRTWTTTATIDGGAYDLTGCALWFTVKARRTDPDADALVRLYWEDAGASAGIAVADPSAGVAVVTMTPAQTATLIGRVYAWDLSLEDAAGRFPPPLDGGDLVVTPVVTWDAEAP